MENNERPWLLWPPFPPPVLLVVKLHACLSVCFVAKQCMDTQYLHSHQLWFSSGVV